MRPRQWTPSEDAIISRADLTIAEMMEKTGRSRAGVNCRRRHIGPPPPKRPSRQAKTCIIDGCEKPFLARGWCNTHYSRWMDHGTTERADRKIGRPRTVETCSVEGCGKPYCARGLCQSHYSQKQSREYYQLNRKEILTKGREWYRRNRDKVAERTSDYRKHNPNAAKWQREYRQRNAEYLKRRNQKLYQQKAAIPVTRRGQRYTAAEIAVIARDDISLTEMCYLTGRSWSSVTTRRHYKPKPTEPRPCEWCGTAFTPTANNKRQQRFCTRRCQSKNRYHRLDPNKREQINRRNVENYRRRKALKPQQNLKPAGWYWREKTSCIHGHPFNDENTRITPNGTRICRTCQRERVREWQQRRANSLRRGCVLSG